MRRLACCQIESSVRILSSMFRKQIAGCIELVVIWFGLLWESKYRNGGTSKLFNITIYIEDSSSNGQYTNYTCLLVLWLFQRQKMVFVQENWCREVRLCYCEYSGKVEPVISFVLWTGHAFCPGDKQGHLWHLILSIMYHNIISKVLCELQKQSFIPLKYLIMMLYYCLYPNACVAHLYNISVIELFVIFINSLPLPPSL